MGVLASPLTILERKTESRDIEAIVMLIDQHEVSRVVVGLPRSMNGSIGTQAEKVLDFTEKLRNCTRAEVMLRDERLTTVEARRRMSEAGIGRGKRKVADDAIAAAIILQSYLDEIPAHE